MDSFSGVTIATARSTIRPTRSSLTRRSHSANNCSIYAFLRFNTSLRQLQREIEVTYKTIHRRVERFAEALDAPSLELRGPVEVDEFYVSTGIKGHERDQRSRFCGLSRRGCGTYDQDKSPVFVLVDRGTEQRYVVPAKSADESTIRLLLTDRQQEPLTVYTDGFCAYDPLDEDEEFDREYVVHGDGEYADDTVHVNTCESHASLARRWLSPHRGISKDRLTQYLRAFQLRRELYRKPGRDALIQSKQFFEINNVLQKPFL